MADHPAPVGTSRQTTVNAPVKTHKVARAFIRAGYSIALSSPVTGPYLWASARAANYERMSIAQAFESEVISRDSLSDEIGALGGTDEGKR